ncbi:hypothetical protein Bhyg_08001, partial [Pseudolycoriella hygida]
MTFFDETVRHGGYQKMLEDEFIPFLRDNNLLEQSFFMQDDAKPHTCNASQTWPIKYLTDPFIVGTDTTT